MANTLLAVDDSVTMRKVLEITFAGTEFRVVTAEGADAALDKLGSEKPDLVITDVTLDPKNGYELCREIKAAAPGTAVLILSSKQNPYDAAQGTAAGADDHMDKPFDTQQMIDKVKKLMAARGEGAVATPAAAAAAPQRVAPSPTAAASPGARAKTLIYQPGAPAPVQAARPAGPAPGATAPAPTPAAAPLPTPVSGVPLQSRPSPVAAPPAAPPAPAAAAKAPAAQAASAVASGVNGEMAGKLAEMGLSTQQAEAVMALSREVVERVVWEVVPVLAETLIKEEIARLTK